MTIEQNPHSPGSVGELLDISDKWRKSFGKKTYGELQDSNNDLIEALERARQYVQLTHSNIAAANHNDESPCKQDLAMIDAALQKAKQ